jgi:hypothetical protein
VVIDLFTALGANTYDALPELYTALETGTVDGQENPFSKSVSAKMYEVRITSQSPTTLQPEDSGPLTKAWDKMNEESGAFRSGESRRATSSGRSRVHRADERWPSFEEGRHAGDPNCVRRRLRSREKAKPVIGQTLGRRSDEMVRGCSMMSWRRPARQQDRPLCRDGLLDDLRDIWKKAEPGWRGSAYKSHKKFGAGRSPLFLNQSAFEHLFAVR